MEDAAGQSEREQEDLWRDVDNESRRIAIQEGQQLVQFLTDAGVLTPQQQETVSDALWKRHEAIGTPEQDMTHGTEGVEGQGPADPGD